MGGDQSHAEAPPPIAIAFDVIDNGVGIPPGKQPLVFQPFIQGEQGSTRRFSGCGLGLALSKSLVEAMGGTIRLRSPALLPGQTISNVGTNVSFTVPLQALPDRRPPEQMARAPGVVVLLVISNDRVRLQIANMLTAANFRWRAVSLADAVACIKGPPTRHLLVVDEDNIVDRGDAELIAPLQAQGLVLMMTLGAKPVPNSLAKPLTRGQLVQWLEKALGVPRRRSSGAEVITVQLASRPSSFVSNGPGTGPIPAAVSTPEPLSSSGSLEHTEPDSLRTLGSSRPPSLLTTPGTPLLGCLGSFTSTPQNISSRESEPPSTSTATPLLEVDPRLPLTSPACGKGNSGTAPRHFPSPRASVIRRSSPRASLEGTAGPPVRLPPELIPIPVLTVPSVPAIPGPPSPPSSTAEVLVAEDNVVLQVVMRQHLKSLGHRCHVCDDGQKVLARLAQQWAPVIFMDYHMPEMDGITCTRAIREKERLGAFPGRPPIHIVATTADMVLQTKEACLAAGMDGFLAKPVARKDLAVVLRCFGGPASAGARQEA